MNLVTIALLLSLLPLPVVAQETKPEEGMKDCPMHNQHAAHHAAVEEHGDRAMGFPHDKTTHHFRMAPDGGTIEVSADAAGDKLNVDAIRHHLTHVAEMFAKGDFSIPMFVHDGVPPGMTTMKLMKSTIRYSYEEMPSGGKVRIKTDDPIAVAAIHDFFRFQINEHETGDSLQFPEN